MKRSLALSLIGVLLLAGCVGPLGATAGTSGDAGTVSDGDETTIAVSAVGTTSADPDLAVVRVGVEATAETATAARDQVATDVSNLRSGLAAAGVPDANVTTTAFGIAPVYADAEGDREVVGYRARHSLTVETSPARAGDVVDTAVDSGATSVDGVEFTLSDDRRTALRAAALDRAMSAARSDADGLASAADRSVTGVRHVSTGAEFVPTYRFEDAAGGTELRSAPVTVTVTVDVTYAAN